MIFTQFCRVGDTQCQRGVENMNFCGVKSIDAVSIDNYEIDENWEYKSVHISVHRRGHDDARKNHIRRK